MKIFIYLFLLEDDHELLEDDHETNWKQEESIRYNGKKLSLEPM